MLKEYFDIEYGQREYHSKGRLTGKEGDIPLISSKGSDNGVYGFFDIEPQYRNVITVPSTGTVCHAFYQGWSCCVDDNCLVLKPKKNFKIQEFFYFVLLIRKEKYRYMYGRQVTPERLGKMKVPMSFPKWIYKIKFNFDEISKSINKKNISLSDKKWKKFNYGDVFDIERGYYNKRPETEGNMNFISASIYNNGVTDGVAKEVVEKIFEGNCITVVNNGHAGEAFYQKKDFTCSHDVNILRIKNHQMNPYIAMFLIPVIRKETYRFNYGRKWRYDRMQKSELKLPVDDSGQPDWKFMETYIKSLSYSQAIS